MSWIPPSSTCHCAEHAEGVEGQDTIGTIVFGCCDSLFRSRRMTLVGRMDHSPVIDKRLATSTMGMNEKGLCRLLLAGFPGQRFFLKVQRQTTRMSSPFLEKPGGSE